jgi:small-conductance mechanosensitive channel
MKSTRADMKNNWGLIRLLLRGCLLLGMVLNSLLAYSEIQSMDLPYPEAHLIVMNRELATFKIELGGANPENRAERAKKRFSKIDDFNLSEPIKTEPFTLGNQKGVQFQLGNQFLFALSQGDLDLDAYKDFDELIKDTVKKLEEYRSAQLEQREWPRTLRSLLYSLVATLALLIFGWLLRKFFNVFFLFLREKSKSIGEQNKGGHWKEYVIMFFARFLQAIYWLITLIFAYIWITYCLKLFPLTVPLGQKLGGYIWKTLQWISHGVINAMPNIITILVILSIARILSDLMTVFFKRVETGDLNVSIFHQDTIKATQRIATIILWGLTLAIIYPFIPGSHSEAFKGLSVLFGLVISLGSTGIVNQMMSGLVVVYSRALRIGDYVQVNGVSGVVTEIGGLATKIQTQEKIETTIPNSLLIGDSIQNFSKLNEGNGALLSTKVTIGYDASWRVVHQLLLSAASQNKDLRLEPAPKVFQRALSDFYVEYELFVYTDSPEKTIVILSNLHQEIQDAFNGAGIQMMSPHFMSQPDQAVIASKER